MLFLENTDSDSRALPGSLAGDLIKAPSTNLWQMLRRLHGSFGQMCMTNSFPTYQVAIEPRMATTTNFRTGNTTT